MDLADRISRGAVAALDLAPDDPRFAELSRQVLQGGASRFATVVDPRESVDYVIPVGVPEASVNFGALVVQVSRIGAIWRDPHQGEHHALVALGPDTRATWSPVTLGGEQWARFDLDDRHTTFSFLAPPTGSPLLRMTLARLLGVESAGFSARTELIPAVGGVPSPEPAPSPVPPILEPVPPVPEPVPQVPDEHRPLTPVPEWSSDTPVPPPPVPPRPVLPSTPWEPESGVPLYRDETRIRPPVPASEPTPSANDATVVRGALPEVTLAPAAATLAPEPTAAVPTAVAGPVARRTSATLVGFVVALAATLVLGGIALASLALLR